MNKDTRIYIMGFMGAGKSTIGKKLARALGYSFIDLDHYICEKSGCTIEEIFKNKGEAYFRELEHQSLLEVAEHKQVVIALGGGTPLRPENLDIILKDTSIYVQMPEGALFQRLIHSKNPRPLLQGLSEEELKDYIHHTLQKREPIYLKASIHMDGLNYTAESLVLGLDSLV